MEETFEEWLRHYGDLLVKELKYQLVFGSFDYAPGFNGSRQISGSSNKFAGIGFGYETSLAGSITANYRFDDDGGGEVDILMNEYWKWVNQGRQPGSYVPIKPLIEWAKSPVRLGLSEDEAKGAAFGISRNIYKFGVAPTYFFDLAVDNVESALEQQNDKLEQDINDFLTQVKVIDLPPIRV